MKRQNLVLILCVAACLLSIAAFLFFGASKGESPVAARYAEYLRSNPEKAIILCSNETPFLRQGSESKLYAHSCLLEVACKFKKDNYTIAIRACQAMDSIPVLGEDDNISSNKCIVYIDANCA